MVATPGMSLEASSSDTSAAVPERMPYARKRGAATPPAAIAPARYAHCLWERELRMSYVGTA